MKRLLTLLLINLPLFLYGQLAQQPEYVSFKKAKAAFDKAIYFCGVQTDTLNFSIIATGITHESGHYPTPGQRIDMPESYTMCFYQGSSNYFLKGETMVRGQLFNRQVYVKNDSLFFRNYFARGVSRKTAEGHISLFDEVLTLNPVLLLQTIRRQGLPSMRYMGKAKANELITTVVNGTLFTLHIAPNGQLIRVSFLAPHPYYGDNIHIYEYDLYKHIGGFTLPTVFREYEFGALRKEEKYSYDLSPNYELPYNQVCPGCGLVATLKSEVPATVKSIAANLYAIELNEFSNRSLVLVGEKDITVFEAPLSYIASKHIVRAVNRLAPGKPIGQVFISHHHPDHAGGLRAFVEIGATIITTKGNPNFLSQLVNSPQELAGQTTYKSIKPAFAIVDSNRTFNAGTTSVFSVYTVVNTQHTDEYLVAYFPEQHVLFHGDLCFFPQDGAISPASVREQAVGTVINQNMLNVEKIYGSWPTKGCKEFGTKAELDLKLQAVK